MRMNRCDEVCRRGLAMRLFGLDARKILRASLFLLLVAHLRVFLWVHMMQHGQDPTTQSRGFHESDPTTGSHAQSGASVEIEVKSQEKHFATKLKPDLDTAEDEDQHWESLQRSLPNAPLDLIRLQDRRTAAERGVQPDKMCRQVPRYWNLRSSGRGWQVAENEDGNSLYLYSAHGDGREDPGGHIRIIVISNRYDERKHF